MSGCCLLLPDSLSLPNNACTLSRPCSANSAGWGSWALPVECSTAADVPEAPGPPSIAEAGTVRVLLSSEYRTACLHPGSFCLVFSYCPPSVSDITTVSLGLLRAAQIMMWRCFCPLFGTASDLPNASYPNTPQASLGLQWHPPLHNGGAKISGYR